MRTGKAVREDRGLNAVSVPAAVSVVRNATAYPGYFADDDITSMA